MVKGKLSVIIPNRNCQFTTQTINDVLKNAGCDIEVIINVDENWPEPLIKDDDRVHYIHPPTPIGLRKGINKCVAMAKGEYIMKTDDHCAFGENFGKILIENHQDNWVQIPRRYALNAEEWRRETSEERGNDKYPIDYMYIDFPRKGKAHDDGMHGVPWKDKREERKDPKFDIDNTPSMQGSCYFMTKDWFDNFLGGLSEVGYGQFSQEAQEIGFRTWLGGGAVKVNKKTWYSHLYKGRRYGRMYSVPNFNQYTRDASNWSAWYWLNNRWEKRIHDFEWFIDKRFPDMPSWPKNWKEEIRKMGWIK